MNFYVYVYLNVLKPGKFNYDNISFDYEPFYVGKGKNNRMNYHLNKVKNNCKYKNSPKIEIIKNNLSLGFDPIIVKLFDSLTEENSLNIEKEVIQKIGRIDLNSGPLTNRNDGGKKPQDNYKHTQEVKDKISKSVKLRDPEKRYTLISPDGIIYENIKLLDFCNKNNLDYQKIRKSYNKGKIKPIRSTSIKQSKQSTINCQGWEVINKKSSNILDKSYPKWKLISPTGLEIVIFSNEFIIDKCNEYNLDQRTIRYYKNLGKIDIKNKNQANEKTINCQGWQFIDLPLYHQFRDL